LVFLVLADVIH